MSYCRWSSDYFECDLYVYEDVSGGWTSMVAGRRFKHPVPQSIKDAYPTWGDPEWVEKTVAAEKGFSAWRDSFPHDEFPCNELQPDGATKPGVWTSPKDSEWIDLESVGPEAGGIYNDDSPGECADRLEALRTKGFRVPQYAIDSLREEQAELDRATAGAPVAPDTPQHK